MRDKNHRKPIRTYCMHYAYITAPVSTRKQHMHLELWMNQKGEKKDEKNTRWHKNGLKVKLLKSYCRFLFSFCYDA